MTIIGVLFLKRPFFWEQINMEETCLAESLLGQGFLFFIGFVAVFISLIIGISLGSIAGYFGGKTDAIIMWLINVTWSIPTLLLVIAITLALGKGFWQVFIAVGLYHVG